MNAHDEKQEERRILANLRRGIELTELALASRLATLQHPNVAFFNVAFPDSPQKTCALPGAQQSTPPERRTGAVDNQLDRVSFG